MQLVLGRDALVGRQAIRLAFPANAHATKEVSFGARHAIKRGRTESRLGAEDLGVGMERDSGAATVARAARGLELRCRLATHVLLRPDLFVARHLDLETVTERVDHGNADAMQAAGGVVNLVAELAARVQRRHDHFESRFVLELGVLVDRDAAAIVLHRQAAVGGQFDVDGGGVAGHRLVHGVVQRLGRKVVQAGGVGAADVHAGAAAHRFQALQHLDVLGGIFAGRLGGACLLKEIGHQGQYDIASTREKRHFDAV